jgi:hypothetical protein
MKRRRVVEAEREEVLVRARWAVGEVEGVEEGLGVGEVSEEE